MYETVVTASGYQSGHALSDMHHHGEKQRSGRNFAADEGEQRV